MDLLDVQTQAALDPEFRARLAADPAGTLASVGIHVPQDVTIELHESTPSAIVLCLPPLDVQSAA